MRLQFLGANKQVTGSCYVLEAAGLRLMIDCGMFQERQFLARNWDTTYAPDEPIDYLLLTHAHLDHCGLIPRRVAQGFDGPILTVEPTVDLARIIMLDAGRIQEEDAAYKKKRHKKEGRRGKYPEIPLYTAQDAEKSLPLLRGVTYEEPISLNDRVTVTFYEAGHILGSACLEIVVTETGATRRVVFSGDLGQWETPLVGNPSLLKEADYVVMESTYGDRNHKEAGTVDDQLADVVNAAVKRGGNLVIPTFALERAQELIYYLGRLIDTGRIPAVRVFLDSPMAVDITEVFHRHCRYLDDQTRCGFESGTPALRFTGLKLVRDVKDSIALNNMGGTNVIMAGAGMCTGGRIKHHLRANITRPESTILFVGYQAQGTLGRQILDGSPQVRIHGRQWPVRAKIAQIFGLSAHGDHDDLLHWLGGFRRAPRRLFLTHGEEEAAEALARSVEKRYGWTVTVPDYQEAYPLD